jgi:NADH-quinone oxidoreductase subunit E
MSVRRLSPNQPQGFTFSASTLEQVEWWINKYPENRRQSAVIPILWLIQKQEGWISEPAIAATAKLLGMAEIRVYEVATFYTMFMLEPVGSAALIQVCGTTPCMLRGSDALIQVCKDKIGPKDRLSKDGKFMWQEVECLGACTNAPMAQINDYYYEDLTPENLGTIIDAFGSGLKPKSGPYNGRHTSEPLGGVTSLNQPSLYDGSAAKPVKIPNRPEAVVGEESKV